jgi:hypothetical protein
MTTTTGDFSVKMVDWDVCHRQGELLNASVTNTLRSSPRAATAGIGAECDKKYAATILLDCFFVRVVEDNLADVMLQAPEKAILDEHFKQLCASACIELEELNVYVNGRNNGSVSLDSKQRSASG